MKKSKPSDNETDEGNPAAQDLSEQFESLAGSIVEPLPSHNEGEAAASSGSRELMASQAKAAFPRLPHNPRHPQKPSFAEMPTHVCLLPVPLP